jgi:hypothetical protein
MTKKKVTILVLGGLAAFIIAGAVMPNHHPHFPWDRVPGFYGLFGVLAGLALIGIALGLGNFFLWRPTVSVQLAESLVADGVTQAVLKSWQVQPDAAVKKGDALLVLRTDKGDVTVDAPVDGIVRKLFYYPEDIVDVGWTLADLQVSKHVMHHGIGGEK